MATVRFAPSQVEIDVGPGTKVLVAARKAKVDIRFGCASCQCGTCGVKVAPSEALGPMEDDERALLQKMYLPTDGSIRLACRAKTTEASVEVDLDFQQKYSPDQGLLEDESN